MSKVRIEVLRLPVTHLRSLICFASGAHANLLGSCLAAACAPRRSEGAFRAGVIVQPATQLPVCSHVDVSGTSQVPRRSIPCLCPALRPRPNRRSLASLTVASMLPPRFPRRRLQRFMNFGAHHAASAPAAYASRMVSPPSMQSSLPAGWLAFTGRELNPLDRYKRFQITFSSPFSGFILAQEGPSFISRTVTHRHYSWRHSCQTANSCRTHPQQKQRAHFAVGTA